MLERPSAHDTECFGIPSTHCSCRNEHQGNRGAAEGAGRTHPFWSNELQDGYRRHHLGKHEFNFNGLLVHHYHKC